MTDGKKIAAMRAALQKLADSQPTQNTIGTWAIEGVVELPSYAMLDLFNAVVEANQ